MSNRRKAAYERLAQLYRNAGKGDPVVHTDGRGRARRGQGRNNFPYGPLVRHPSVGVATLHRLAERPRRSYVDHSRDAEKRAMLEAKTRDELRVICKAQNVQGWHKMNKNQLVEAALA